jgi:hypothetical protein
MRPVSVLKGGPVFLRNAFFTGARLAVVMALFAPAFSQQETCPCPVRDSQNQGRSLADVAKEAKKNKAAHAKKAVTDEDIESKKGPLPRLNIDDSDNSDEIIQAIGDFKAKHSEQQVEQAIHNWYDEYDEMLATAIRENIQMRDQRESTAYHSYEMCQQGVSYDKCQQQRQTEIRGARHDGFVMRDNGMVTGRIQQAFMKIRAGLSRNNLHYDWFKVRNGNGIGSF